MSEEDRMKPIKKDAVWWTIVLTLWIVMLTVGIIDKVNNFVVIGAIFVPIAGFNAAKKWIMVKKGWAT